MPDIFSYDVLLLSSQKLFNAKTFGTEKKEERKNTINQTVGVLEICFVIGTALPLDNLIDVGFITNIWQVMIIIPYITLEHVLEQDLYLTFEYVVKLKTLLTCILKYLLCRGKVPFGFPEEDLEVCSMDKNLKR